MNLTERIQTYRNSALGYTQRAGNNLYAGETKGLGDVLTTPISELAGHATDLVKKVYVQELPVMKAVAMSSIASISARAAVSAYMSPDAPAGITSLAATIADYIVFHAPMYALTRKHEIARAEIEGRDRPTEKRIAAEYVGAFGVIDKLYAPITALAQYTLQRKGVDPATAAALSAGAATTAVMFVLPPLRAAVKSVSRRIATQ
jgi:hypothetical protein